MNRKDKIKNWMNNHPVAVTNIAVGTFMGAYLALVVVVAKKAQKQELENMKTVAKAIADGDSVIPFGSYYLIVENQK